MTLIPESTGGEKVYLGNIVCLQSKPNDLCKRDEESNLFIGNPCIMNLANCISQNDSNLRGAGWTPVEINGPDWTKQPRLREVLLSKLTRASLQQSILLYSIATSAALALFIGLYVWAARSLSGGFAIFILAISGIPHLWTFLGSIYPALNCALLLAISLGSTALLQSHEKKSIKELCIIIIVSLGAFALSSGSRFDLYLVCAALLFISTLSVFFGKHEFHKRNWITAIAIQASCWFIIYINRIKPGTQSRNAMLFLNSKLELSETAEVTSNLAKGIVQTGSISQRIWYALTAPVYYFYDWGYPFGIRGIVVYATTLLLAGLVLLLLVLGERRELLEFERKLFKRFDNYQFLILIAILALPMAPSTGHLRLRMIAILLLPLGLTYFTKRKFQNKFVILILSLITVINLVFLIPRFFSQANLPHALGFSSFMILAVYLLAISVWYLTTLQLNGSNSESRLILP